MTPNLGDGDDEEDIPQCPDHQLSTAQLERRKVRRERERLAEKEALFRAHVRERVDRDLQEVDATDLSKLPSLIDERVKRVRGARHTPFSNDPGTGSVGGKTEPLHFHKMLGVSLSVCEVHRPASK